MGSHYEVELLERACFELVPPSGLHTQGRPYIAVAGWIVSRVEARREEKVVAVYAGGQDRTKGGNQHLAQHRTRGPPFHQSSQRYLGVEPEKSSPADGPAGQPRFLLEKGFQLSYVDVYPRLVLLPPGAGIGRDRKPQGYTLSPTALNLCHPGILYS